MTGGNDVIVGTTIGTDAVELPICSEVVPLEAFADHGEVPEQLPATTVVPLKSVVEEEVVGPLGTI